MMYRYSSFIDSISGTKRVDMLHVSYGASNHVLDYLESKGFPSHGSNPYMTIDGLVTPGPINDKIKHAFYHYDPCFLTKDEANDIVKKSSEYEYFSRKGVELSRNLLRHQVPHFDKLYNKIIKVNDDIFKLDVTAVFDFVVMKYKEGDTLDWHYDGGFKYDISDPEVRITNDMMCRKMNVLVMLTDESEYEGGEFLFIDPTSHPSKAIHSIKMTAGEALIFPSFCMHRVNAVKKGRRMTLVSDLYGPMWR